MTFGVMKTCGTVLDIFTFTNKITIHVYEEKFPHKGHDDLDEKGYA